MKILLTSLVFLSAIAGAFAYYDSQENSDFSAALTPDAHKAVKVMTWIENEGIHPIGRKPSLSDEQVDYLNSIFDTIEQDLTNIEERYQYQLALIATELDIAFPDSENHERAVEFLVSPDAFIDDYDEYKEVVAREMGQRLDVSMQELLHSDSLMQNAFYLTSIIRTRNAYWKIRQGHLAPSKKDAHNESGKTFVTGVLIVGSEK